MSDREKVIKGLEICTTRPCYCTDCPYIKECCLDSQELMEDALTLLKEQEAIKPTKANNPDESEYCCGICGYPLWSDEFYCAHCGRRIKWEGR